MDEFEYDIITTIGKIRVFQTSKFINRPTIIFLHDSLGCIKLWRDYPVKLGDHANCNILIYDRQGHGRSSPFSYSERDKNYMETETDILHEIMQSCKVNKAILFGHSDGGSISLIYSAKYPANVLGIITEGAHIFVENKTIEGIRETVNIYNTTDLKIKLEKYHSDKTEKLFNAWTDTWLSKGFRDWNIENILHQITCPVLAIQGENDEFGTKMQVDGITAKVAGLSTAVIVPNARHAPHNENPGFILERSLEFIAGLS